MTFQQARDILRNDILAEVSTDYFTDADLFAYLKRASQELAYMFGFPRAIVNTTLSNGDISFTLPSDAANIDVQEIAFDGFTLSLAPYRGIAHLVNQLSVGQPRFYNYDVKRSDMTVYVAPRPTRSGVLTYEYIREYNPDSLLLTDPIWEGLFPAFHELVIYRAAIKAFDASLESERSGFWIQREQKLSQEFSLFLNKTPANEVLGQQAVES